MNEFEEWSSREFYGTYSEERSAKTAWRAALKWLNSKLDSQEHKEIKDMIEEELK